MQTLFKPLFLSFSLLVCSFLVPEQTYGQISDGGRPLSYTLGIQPNVDIRELPAINIDSLLIIDDIEEREGKPYRFGKAIPIHLNLKNSGTWETLDNGASLWRLRIRTQGAKTININYDEFDLPIDAKYFIYNPNDTSEYIGAFTHKNNADGGLFATSMLLGGEVILEYYEPAEVKGEGIIEISSVVHGYKGMGITAGTYNKLFGDSQPCNINVSCPEADGWRDQVRSVVMIALDSATRFCSGVLINNVRADQTPYILTADHCQDGIDPVSVWTFYFNYDSPLVDPGNCDSTVRGTLKQNIVGAQIKAAISVFDDSDNMLLLLNNSVPSSFNAFFAGWSNDSTPPPFTKTIHHPLGDVKKISFDNDSATFRIAAIRGYQWQAIYHPNSGTGLVETSSSGAPLFDHNKRVIATHSIDGHSGPDSCSLADQAGYFGNFYLSWDNFPDSARRLKYWLDPDTTDTLFIDGIDPNVNCCIGDRGDVNGDGTDADVLDLTFLIDYIFRAGVAPACTEEADMNSDGAVNILDLTYLIDYIFRGGPAPGPC